jgi:hypothetical protein
MDRDAVNVNDRREGAETAADKVQRIIAEFEAADRKLADHLSAGGRTDAATLIEEVRSVLRTAISALTASASAEAGEDASTAKRRVKIKAEGSVAPPNETARTAGVPAKAGAAAAKPATRGARSQEGPRTARRAASAGKAPTGSLLARLDAATDIATAPPAQAEPPAATGTSSPVETDTPIQDTAERLALLEAEIADLTEAVTAMPTTPAGAQPLRAAAAQPAPDDSRTPGPPPASAWPGTPDVGSDDEEDAEITIIGADGAPTEPASYTARQTPRIFREESSPLEEEAEVEIHGQNGTPSAGRSTERSETVRISARTSPGTSKGSALGKWRRFRSSH